MHSAHFDSTQQQNGKWGIQVRRTDNEKGDTF